MSTDTTTLAIELFVGLVAAAGLVGWLIHRLSLPIPYTVALVVLGVVAGVVLPIDIEVSPEIVLLVLLPGLVFEAALRIDIDDFRRTFGGVVLLAALERHGSGARGHRIDVARGLGITHRVATLDGGGGGVDADTSDLAA